MPRLSGVLVVHVAAILLGAGCAGTLADADLHSSQPGVACSDVTELNVVYFDEHSAELTDDASSRLAGMALLLQRCTDIRLDVRGYTDGEREVSTPAARLGLDRAQAVARRLTRLGIEADRVWCTSDLGAAPNSGLPPGREITAAVIEEMARGERRVETLPVLGSVREIDCVGHALSQHDGP